MDDKFVILPRPIQVPTGPTAANRPAGVRQTPSVSFDEVLAAEFKSEPVKFSRHAESRMESRGIRFGTEELGRLQQAVEAAGAKGARDSLVLLDGTALVVSVKNNTVVTVADREQLRGNVFTNIDSAVIA